MDNFPHIVITYERYEINWINIDLGYNKSNNNYWLDITILGLGFDYGSQEGGLNIVNNWKK